MSYRWTTSSTTATVWSRTAGSPGSIHSMLPYRFTSSGCVTLMWLGEGADLADGGRARYGLNHACSSSPRLWASVTANSSGSYHGFGALPIRPVRYSDHGSYGHAYIASVGGRTHRITAFNRRATARSKIPSSSSFCSCVESPGCEGQSIFSTDATHTPLNSRRIGGGVVRLCAESTCDCPQAVSTPAST